MHQLSPEALQQHKRLHDALAGLRGQVHQLGRQNKAAPQLERLSAEDLVVDVRLRTRLREAAAQSITRLQVGPCDWACRVGGPALFVKEGLASVGGRQAEGAPAPGSRTCRSICRVMWHCSSKPV